MIRNMFGTVYALVGDAFVETIATKEVFPDVNVAVYRIVTKRSGRDVGLDTPMVTAGLFGHVMRERIAAGLRPTITMTVEDLVRFGKGSRSATRKGDYTVRDFITKHGNAADVRDELMRAFHIVEADVEAVAA